MSDLNRLFDISKKHLVGKMVFTNKANAPIASLELPDEKNIVTVTAKDLVHNNLVFSDYSMPVLADGFSSYENQCLLAVFGPDWNSVDLYIKRIKVNYGEAYENQSEVVYSKQFKEGKPLYGQHQDYSSVFAVRKHSSELLGDSKIIVSQNNGTVNIKTWCQSTEMVQENIALCSGLDRDNINVFAIESDAVFSQLFFSPVIASVVATVAAVKSGMMVEISMPMQSFHPEITFEITSKLGKENRVIMQTATVTVDMGAFPVFTEEYAKSIIMGINPPYALDSAQTDVKIIKSSSHPACVFAGLGFSMAVAAEENHYNKLVRHFDERQSLWRFKHIEYSDIKKMLYSCPNFDLLRNSLSDVCASSWFDRQDSVNLQSFNKTPVLKYFRGIALSCGTGSIETIRKKSISNSSASMVLSLYLDSVLLVPVIDHIWVRLNYTGEFDMKKEVNSLRYMINQTIDEVCPCAQKFYDIDLTINSDADKNEVSAQSLTRGLTAACFTSALSQALSCAVKKLPVYENDILEIVEIRKQKKKEENNETDNEY